MRQENQLSVRRRVCCWLACCCLSSGLAVTTVSTVAAAADGRTALIGFAARLTDIIVPSAQQGAELALEDANEQSAKSGKPNPIRFELLPQNDYGGANMAAYVANYFVTAHVVGVVGHWNTDAALAVAAAYEQAGIAQVNFTSTNSLVTRLGYKTTFRVVGSTADLASALASVATDVLHGQHIAVIGNDSSYSQALSEQLVNALQARSVTVQQRSVISTKTSDFNAALQAAIDKPADVIIFSGYVTQSSEFTKAARRLGVKAKILLNDGATNHRFSVDESDNLYTIEPDIVQPQRPDWKAFEQKFQARYGSTPTSYSHQAYHAASMLIRAVRQADSTDPAKVSQTLHRIRYTGLGCEIVFDQAGNNAHPAYTLYHLEQQRWKVIKFLPDGNCFKGR